MLDRGHFITGVFMGKEKVKKFSIDGGYLIYDFNEDGTVTSTAYLKQMRKEKKAESKLMRQIL